MPNRPPQMCVAPGCAALVQGRRCRVHAAQQEHARTNWDVRRWYRTPRWKLLRALVLRESAYTCAGCGLVMVALEVDHVRKHDGSSLLFWQRANLQALCRSCHQRKTQRGE